MNLTADLQPGDRERAESRLRSNLMAWLTTVRPDGQPVTVPVWFCSAMTTRSWSTPGRRNG